MRANASRRRGLSFSLYLIAGYERDQLRTREWNPLHVRTPEESRHEYDYYHRRAYLTWGFPELADQSRTATNHPNPR